MENDFVQALELPKGPRIKMLRFLEQDYEQAPTQLSGTLVSSAF